mmetsp:Transcript_15670/g.26220  ORF Transcript_15670/g.26220 Transcript_15670/m.26220 type:complete len:90 (+) Transcript_15670:913-1182(+)
MILINEKLQVIRENKDAKYGGMCIVFAGDFSQLPPVRSAPIYKESELHIWGTSGSMYSSNSTETTALPTTESGVRFCRCFASMDQINNR